MTVARTEAEIENGDMDNCWGESTDAGFNPFLLEAEESAAGVRRRN